MRRLALRRAAALGAAAALMFGLQWTTAATASAQPEVQADVDNHSVDNRGATAQPTDRQRTLADGGSTTVRWNRYGTPATLVPRADAQRRLAAADPVATARGFLSDNKDTFGLDQAAIDGMDVLVSRPMGQGSYVMLRQRFGSMPPVLDGLAAFGIRDGAVRFLTSTLSPQHSEPQPATISPNDALASAASDANLSVQALTTTNVQLGAVPMPDAAPRAAYQVVTVGDTEGYTSYVDARTGKLLYRESIVDNDSDPGKTANPDWAAFPSNPPTNHSSRDTRVKWCFVQAPGCERAVSAANDGSAWDTVAGVPSLTSAGNSERGTEKWDDLAGGTAGTRTSTTSPTRDYVYPWTNQWFNSKCDPAVFASPQQNDIDAALANLFAMHNRMHDWSYRLGFTEETWNMQVANGTHSGLGGDAERGQAQSGGRAGGAPPAFPSRNNANQATPPDGVPPTTNMYLWEPTPGGFYAPCVDGDYDMSVIAHEYSHAISGRMIAGPNSGWVGQQANSMNESTSDLFSMEYLYEYGFRAAGDTPFVTGGYVTGNKRVGIRDYDISRNPLNYSDFSFDLTGPEVHADGEIWNATSFAVRQAMVDKYGLATPAIQRQCADGQRPVDRCPGNRRWVQQTFDALLLNAAGAVSFVDMRDAILAANDVRFGGADVPELWNAFAQHGLGKDATSKGTNDLAPIPSFASPFAKNVTVRLVTPGPARLYVGDYEARSRAVADTDPATPLPDTLQIAPGTYDFTVASDGFGSVRIRRTIHAGDRERLQPLMFRNFAAKSMGATATGDGVNLDKLIDGTEATDWASVGSPVAGKNVRIQLAGDRPHLVNRVQVSALLRPAIAGDADVGGQNRFTALRQFEILSCNTAFGKKCEDPAEYRHVYTSPADAFPADIPRPVAPDLTMRSFRIPPTFATNLMVRVLSNQCTGTPAYAGQQHNDPRSNSDCTTGNPTVAQTVRIAEFQAFLF
ncbi:M36 family metallopeptidase [Actinocrispum wychmicini]|uniref:Fungalysin metallopeptidase (M36) n=1 Tax=Actinocrispum wychmicini TaxID=1213861 RepID=A0A4R2JKV9_9PSEU|nr:M36 family metallopeptidase [Actinocrispum wychmicini]TCO59804.1 fungalysin metallopeptidase (M36) [Actinocrispum wychmicini]